MTVSRNHKDTRGASFDDASASRFLSEANCKDILDRLTRFARGGGYIGVRIESACTGNVRWSRNQVSTSGDVTTTELTLLREILGTGASFTGSQVTLEFNDTSDAGLKDALHRAEAELRFTPEGVRNELAGQGEMMREFTIEPADTPNIFSLDTDHLDADRRAAAAQALVRSAQDAGMLSAGYVEVSSHSRAVLDNMGHARYFQWTAAQYSVTVRDPNGIGSGWAGIDHHDWSKIDGPGLSQIALDKCLASRNPSRLEPGRYTVILEPQAVCDLVSPMMVADRETNEHVPGVPYYKSPGFSRLGEKLIDDRITISTDPMDPELGYPPWVSWGDNRFLNPENPSPDAFLGMAQHAMTWFDHGVLVNLPYSRDYATHWLRAPSSKGGSSSYRMSGGTTTVAEMIASTERGLLVTRFDSLELLGGINLLMRGCTRDGLWLIERGKIAKPVMNMMFVDSPFFALNKVDALGVPQRVFRPAQPWLMSDPVGLAGVIVPPLKIKDFSFTALSDAI